MIVRGLWGTQINPHEKKHIASDASFKITMASIYKFNGSARTSVYISFQNSTFLLCSLTPEKIEQQVIDLTCLQGESITLTSEGPNTIHLTGNYVTQEGVDDDTLDSEERFVGIDNVDLHQNELGQGSDQEDDDQDSRKQEHDYEDVREHEGLYKQLQRKNLLEQQDQHRHKYTLRKRNQQDNCVGNGIESNSQESSVNDNMNDADESENEDKLDASMLIDNNDTVDPIQQSSPILVTKKNYVDFDESDSFESGTDSVIDEFDVPRLQYLGNIPVQISEPVNHSKEKGKEHVVEDIALDASNLVQNDQNMLSEVESDRTLKVPEKKTETEHEEPRSKSRDGQSDITQEEPTNKSDKNSGVNQYSHMNEPDSASQSRPLLPATTDEPGKTSIDGKKKVAKSKQSKAKPSVHPEKDSSDQPKQLKKENSNQAVKMFDQTKNDSTVKSAQTLKSLSKKERKRLTKQKEQKAKEEKKRKKASAKKKKKEAEPIQKNSNNQPPSVITATSKSTKKNDKSKSIAEGKSIKIKPKCKPTKTENIVKHTSKDNAHDKERLEDKPVTAEKSSLTKKELVTKPILSLDSKSTNSPTVEVSLNDVNNDKKSSNSLSQERTPRYPRRAIGAESLEKLRMMAAADATVAKSISRERGRNKKRTKSVPPDTRPTKKHMTST